MWNFYDPNLIFQISILEKKNPMDDRYISKDQEAPRWFGAGFHDHDQGVIFTNRVLEYIYIYVHKSFTIKTVLISTSVKQLIDLTIK